VVLNFGQKKGTRLRALVESDKGFINWILRSDFPRDMKDIIESAMRGDWPSPPQAAPSLRE
jgi:DNA polymerase-3 subunit epsilon